MSRPVRCAIYTRKSSEEGLEQSFNSLDAQRDACESYIKSQTHEGWRALTTKYDDGGFSGGTMDRPALKHLLEDIASDKIDTVVVYKIDRLTRSLLDFAKIVEAFETNHVSFVSVTQQFNTTTSMGRLTLNVLLSFAQFERELTGERIRDKIAASKRKGMWMGGIVPLGYKVEARKLLIESRTAAIVRQIFQEYLRLGRVSGLKAFLDSRKVCGKQDRPLSRGALYHILNNRVYLGEIVHRKQAYPGKHEAIIDSRLWDKVATKLRANNPAPERKLRVTQSSCLVGLIVDAAGVRYTPTHSVKKGRRYRYYTSQSVLQGKEAAGLARIPAGELESVVQGRLRNLLTSPEELIRALRVERSETLKASVHARTREWAKLSDNAQIQLFKTILRRVIVFKDCIELEIALNHLRRALTGAETSTDTASPRRPLRIRCDIEVKTTRNQIRILSDAREPWEQPPAVSLIRAILRARQWYESLLCSEVRTFEELARQNRVTPRYIRRIFRCASLAPQIVDGLIKGRVTSLTMDRVWRLPLDWLAQQQFAKS
jgi:DNA invertase Pin-like site-specific DNA recombinase